MYKSITCLFLLTCFTVILAHAQIGKISLPLFMYWKKQPASQENIKLLVQGNAQAISQFVETHGGRFKFACGDISSVELPLKSLPALTFENGVTRIEGLSGYRGNALDDKTDTNIHMHGVRQGTGLPQSYNGKNVVMGFIDTGIDFKHPDFKNVTDTTKTRILHIWDQNTSGTPPSGYSYGVEWDSASINNGTCTHDDPANEYGHGTNVAGLGAGNGRANSTFTGIAPASDIMVVSTLFDNNFLSNVLDGVKYIFDKADALGKPCVVNISEGDYSGSHDGRDLYSRMLNNLITAKPGHMVVCAAGNAGNLGNWHLGYSPTSTPQFTFFNYTGYYGAVAFELYVDSTKFSGFQFALGAVNSTYTTNRGTTSYMNFNSLHLANQNIDSITGSISGVGAYTIYVQAHDSVIDASFFITPHTTSDHWRLFTKGSGRFDVWSSYNVLGTSDMVSSGIPTTYQTGYVYPDATMTTVGYFTLADKCITVANYNNRNQYTDYYSTTQYVLSASSLITVGNISGSSSIGPTRLFKIKPEIAAPGDVTMAPSRIATAAALIANSQGYKVAPGGKYNRNGGTSLASPVVAGVVALYLQKHPKASWQQIKDAVLLNTIKDSYTTSTIPNNTWGYGKVNAYAVLKNDFTDSCSTPCVPVSITKQPADIYICSGKPAWFKITATGGCKQYQWQASLDSGKTFYNLSNSSAYKGVSTDSLSIVAIVPIVYGTYYRCVVTGCYPGTESRVVHVHAVTAATLATHVTPDTNRLCYNTRASVSIDSTLAPYITWQYNVTGTGNSTTWATIHTGSDTASVGGIKQNTYIRAVINIPGCSAFSTPSSVAIPDSALHLKLSSVNTTSIIVSWNKTLASYYKLTANGITHTLTHNSFTITGLTPNTNYKIVFKEAGNICGNKADSLNVTTLCTGVTLSLTNSGNSTINLGISGGSGSYKVYYKPLYTGNYSIASVNGSTLSLKSLVSGTTYVLYAVDNAGTCPNKTSPYLYVKTTGGSCTTSAPTLGTISASASSITLRWTGGASSFQYFIQKHGTLSSSSSNTSLDSAVLTGLSPNTLYDVWVINRCTTPLSYGYSSRIDTVRTMSGCSTPSNLVLSNIHCHGFDATWNAVSGATNYSIVFTNVANASAFSYATTNNSYTIKTLTPSTNWHVYVRVRQCNNSFGGAPSNTENAALPVCPLKNDDINDNATLDFSGIKIYPNPTNNYINIISPNPWQKIYLSDALGQVVFRNDNITNTTLIDIHSLAAGIYICTVVMPDGHTLAYKIIVTP